MSSETLNGVFAGDMVNLSGGTASFDNKNVGTGKTVMVSGLSLGGADAGNYALSALPVTATANITPAMLTIGAISDNKVFDGTTGSTVFAQVTGIKGNDSVSGLAERFDSANAGNRNLSFGPLTVNDGNGGGNYILNIASATASGTINPAQLTVTANNLTAVQGGAQPAFTASFSGFPAGLGPSALTGTLVFTVAETPVMPGSFEILPGGLSSSNFTINFVPGTLLLIGGSSSANSSTMNAGDGSPSDQQPAMATGDQVTSTSGGKLANFALPPVPFAINEGDFARSNGLFMGDPVVNSVLGSTNGASATETGNLVVPSLDENGNPIGRLIGFNSTFIETCRARASLCR